MTGLKDAVKETQCLGWPVIAGQTSEVGSGCLTRGLEFDLRHYTPAFAKSVVDAWQHGCRMDSYDQAGKRAC